MERKFLLRAFLPYLSVPFLSAFFVSACMVRGPIHPVAARLNVQAAQALKAGMPERARAPLMVALEYNPCYAGALHNLALVELMGGCVDKAEELELKALDCQDDLVQAMNGLGVIWLGRGELGMAQEWFEHALEVDPGCLDARRNLIDIYKRVGEKLKAAEEESRLEVLEARTRDRRHSDGYQDSSKGG